VAPGTLVFENVPEVKIDLETYGGFSVQSVKRSNPSEPRNPRYKGKQLQWDWLFEGNEGEISFKSVGFTLFFRRPAILLAKRQTLTLEERGGISFERKLAT
jgi:hypothetical protein